MENEGTTILRNVGNRLSIEAASCPRKKTIPQVDRLENIAMQLKYVCCAEMMAVFMQI